MADDVPKPEPVDIPNPSPANESTAATDATRPRPLRTSDNRSSVHTLNSPLRHHTRNHTLPRKVKETLNARSEYTNSQDDGTAEHRINQYLIKQEIGRGSFGAVHLGVDQYGQEYAVKEFSKSRLRKRAQSHVLRSRSGLRRPEARAAGTGFNEPLHRNPSSHDMEEGNSLHLIKEEIAIMKKLNHPNLVSLFEVLDDPTEDSLYMVMEMCKKGVIMKVGLGEESDPYNDESCRCWFRDLILGIEYLHAQGIVHRDIKPDNCLLTSDDVLKIVDFGVSEMFEKDSDMYTAKSAGSPAFLPPELCVVKHGDVSGRAADIWSMGVTLYCLRYGRIPFEKESIFELYEAIRNDEIAYPGETDDIFKDLMSKILEKDPKKRITMEELREHPWVTRGGTDTLLSAEENTSNLIEPPTEEEMNTAITRNMGHAITVVKAVQKFKRLIEPASPGLMKSILGEDEESHFVQPPLSIDESDYYEIPRDRKKYRREAFMSPRVHDVSRGRDATNRGESPTFENIAAGYPRRENSTLSQTSDSPARQGSRTDTPSKGSFCEGTRGHARDPLEEEHPYLFIGPSSFSTHMSAPGGDKASLEIDDGADLPIDVYATPVVSESPSAADIDIYETAYTEEIERIRNRSRTSRAPAPKIYLTRRVDGKKSSLAALLERAKEEGTLQTPRTSSEPGTGLEDDESVSRTSRARGSNIFAAAVSSLNMSTLAHLEAPQGEAPQDTEAASMIGGSDTRLQGSVAPKSPARPNPAAIRTTTEATATENVAPVSSAQRRSGLRNLLNRIKDGR
ncbi:CAMKK/CAMKK-META protein kinase [Coccidioides immitis RS]|uniref:CAMKK/CAMKK-META protein kinase n=2 Tax=Coccidioides immitis TaxID=5501 RepID=J3K7P2_COCIM|nr:CAMKK/CAMKK-META protein kinase [Coccidioides immitis RS]EAS30737.3 CAMKK/CAMKK-META protein kinase [Coccidioides immitis RS]KMU73853.1 calcium/calmodulin-dependent protein kinase 2 [Coccidioides immitis RMSCC 3703]